MRALALVLFLALPVTAGAQSPPPRQLPPPQQSGGRDLPPRQTTGTVAPGGSTPTTPATPPSREPLRTPDSGVSVGGAGTGVYYGQAWRPEVGLQALFYTPDRGRMRLSLNSPAYVTIFELQPGKGVRVLFPAEGMPEQQLPAGWATPPLPTGPDPFAGVQSMDPRANGVRYLYMVASDLPMNFGPQRRTTSALYALLGPEAFRSSGTAQVTSGIRQRVLTLPSNGYRWTDQLISWVPGQQDPLGSNQASQVRCSNGLVYSVAPGQYFECPR